MNDACFLTGPVTMFCIQSPEVTSSACGVFTTDIKISAMQTRFVVILRKLFFFEMSNSDELVVYTCVYMLYTP